MDLFVGIDWGSRVHAVCVMNAEGTALMEREVEHEGDAVLAFVQQLVELADGEMSKVKAAMEAPHGTLIEALMDVGVQAFHLNPKQLDRFRDRHTVAGAKDDALDARVLADSLRTDQKLFRPIPPKSAWLQQLVTEQRTHRQLQDHLLAMSFQVREALQRYYPQLLRLGSWHNEPWLWALAELVPTPNAARSVRKQRVEKLLTRHRIRRYKAEVVLERLRTTPLPAAEGVVEACAQKMLSLLPLLKVTHEQHRQCLKRLDAMLGEAAAFAPEKDDQAAAPPARKESKETQDNVQCGLTAESESHEAMLRDVALLQTLPGFGPRTATCVLARGHIALQNLDYHALRRLAGVAPVSRRTGGRNKAPMVVMRRACDGDLRDAVHMWAWSATQLDPTCKAHYAHLRAKGHSHARALRGLADRLLRIAIGVLKSGTPYRSEAAAQKTAA